VVHRLRSRGSAVHPLTNSGLATAGPFFDPFDLLPMKRIAFEVKSYYGRNLAYPVDPEAFLFLHISRTKTLIPADIGTIRELGFVCVDQNGKEITYAELV